VLVDPLVVAAMPAAAHLPMTRLAAAAPHRRACHRRAAHARRRPLADARSAGAASVVVAITALVGAASSAVGIVAAGADGHVRHTAAARHLRVPPHRSLQESRTCQRRRLVQMQRWRVLCPQCRRPDVAVCRAAAAAARAAHARARLVPAASCRRLAPPHTGHLLAAPEAGIVTTTVAAIGRVVTCEEDSGRVSMSAGAVRHRGAAEGRHRGADHHLEAHAHRRAHGHSERETNGGTM
jgi:hypothetical protein